MQLECQVRCYAIQDAVFINQDVPAENQSQMPQNVVHWSSMQREIDVENGMLQPKTLEIMLQRKISSNDSLMMINLIKLFATL